LKQAPNKRPKVLVIYKKTTLQRYQSGKRVQELIEADDRTVRAMTAAHEEHMRSLGRARETLAALGAQASFRHRYLSSGDRWDLVVTLGGDGTLLWASHMIGRDIPMVAINSAPGSSVGYFCAGGGETLDETLQAALEGGLKGTRLSRMQVQVGGQIVSTRVLNDILFCHECPAATSRYLIQHGEHEEEQISSGIWIGPAAGSTAAQRSAGGKVLPIGSKRIQYVVREPYLAPGRSYALGRGLVEPGEDLRIASKMREGTIYVDGHHRTHRVDIGVELRVQRSSESLLLLGLKRRR